MTKNEQPLRGPNNRGGGFVLSHSHAPSPGGHTLYVAGPAGVLPQLMLIDPRYTHQGDLSVGTAHSLQGEGHTPLAETSELLVVLGGVLTLRALDQLDFALALDWYKRPVQGVAPGEWPNTEFGDLIYQGKYCCKMPDDAEKRRTTGWAICEAMALSATQHPLLRHVDAIAAPPGHDARRVSFGSSIAAGVAQLLTKPLIRCVSEHPFRTPAKAKTVDHQTRIAAIKDQFGCREDVTGQSILIVDDVYSTGATAQETARALRASGATGVASLSVAKTMRSA